VTPRFLADENVDPDLVIGITRAKQDVDIVRVQDVGLRTQDDPAILQWAAREGRILLTHDISTMPDFAYARVVAEETMAGVIIIPTSISMGRAIADVVLIASATQADEWANRVVYLPLR
jgi:predicted nuclease of predicted toxin-antitoxin system